MRHVIAASFIGAFLCFGCHRASVDHPGNKGKRIALFDGSDTSHWTGRNGAPLNWIIENGEFIGHKPDAVTKEKFQDCIVHVEYWLPKTPPTQNRGERANSGVFLQSRYEIQIMDSYGMSPITYQDAGAIYGQRPPDSQASLPPEQWQTMDIDYTAGRFDKSGKMIKYPRATVKLNGTTVQNDQEIKAGATRGGDPEGPSAGPLRLQYHTTSVRFRNIWIEPR
jgi:hypothetical protein